MKKVFLSYSSNDREFANLLVQAFQSCGLSVWSESNIGSGKTYSKAIEEGLLSAACVVVLWSQSSVKSRHVISEASWGMERDILVPVLIDEVGIPWSFGNIQTLSLKDWAGEETDQAFGKLLYCVESHISDPEITQTEKPSCPKPDTQNDFPGKPGPNESKPPTGFQVFISANSKDYSFAGELYAFLTSKNIDTFFSQESLPKLGRADYRRGIDQALEAAAHMIVVTSSRKNVESSYVEAEWGMFINEQRTGFKAGNLITLLVKPADLRDLPLSLRNSAVLEFSPEGFIEALSYLK